MKYALIIYTFITLFYSNPIQARTIHSFKDSPAIVALSQFMVDTANDLSFSYRLTDNKLKLTNTTKCTEVDSKEIINEVETIIIGLMRVFPDEELPIDEALNDLSDYLGSSKFKKCVGYQSDSHTKVKILYFFDEQDLKHVKIDTVVLSQR